MVFTSLGKMKFSYFRRIEEFSNMFKSNKQLIKEEDKESLLKLEKLLVNLNPLKQQTHCQVPIVLMCLSALFVHLWSLSLNLLPTAYHLGKSAINL